jgi:hypothetical protein
MLFKSVLGKTYELDVTDDLTFRQITDLFNEKFSTNYTIIFINSGRTLLLDNTVKDTVGDIYIVTKPAPEAPEVPAQEAASPSQEVPVPVPVLASESESESESDEPETILVTGSELKDIIASNSDLLFDVICHIGRQNPFFLSYLAVNPEQARSCLHQFLDDPNFRMSVDEESVKPYLMHPCGTNGYEVDQRNLDYIIRQCPNLVAERQQVKETYLLLDRDIEKTITALNSPNRPLIGHR